MAKEPVKVGIAGCGGISRLYTGIYGGLADLAQVVAVADPVDGRAEARGQALTDAYSAEAHRARVLAANARSDQARETQLMKAEAAKAASEVKIRVYRSHEELLKDEEVQVMTLLTSPKVRFEPTIAAAETGRHVFTEGPLASSVEEADAMVAAVRKAGVKFHAQAMDRYPRGMALARKAVESGKLGKIGSANVERNSYHPPSYWQFGGSVGRSDHTMHRTWMGTWEGEGGGAVFHHGRYIIDPFLWVVGSRVVEVFAYAGPMLRDIETDSLSQAVVRFDNGATGVIHMSLITHTAGLLRGARGRILIIGNDAAMAVYNETSYGSIATFASENDQSPRLNVRSDTVFASNDNPDALEALEALRAEVEEIPEEAAHEYQTRKFLESIINDTEPLVPIEIPHHHVEVTRAIFKSAEEHRPVTLPLDKSDPFYSNKGRITAKSG